MVINGALEGMSPADIDRAWNDKWRQYQPDVVVLGLNAWMVSLAPTHASPTSFEALARRYGEPASKLSALQLSASRVFHSIHLVGFTSIVTQRALYWIGLLDHRVKRNFPYGSVIAYGWQQGDLPADQPTHAWSAFQSQFAQLAQQVQSTGARIVLVWLPPRFDLSDSIIDNEKNVQKERFSMTPAVNASAIARAAGAEFVDVLPHLKAARHLAEQKSGEAEDYYIHFDVGHFNDLGNRRVAEAIVERL